MPKTDPMPCADAFGSQLVELVGAGISGGKDVLVKAANATVDAIRQRDRDTLTAAAERVCAKCEGHRRYCEGQMNCWKRKAILSPIADKEGYSNDT